MHTPQAAQPPAAALDPAPRPWYEHGLAFACTRCGNCCTGAPGYVWVSLQEMHALATRLGLTLDAFSRQYVRLVGDRFSLIERPNGECVFWHPADGCQVYPDRPTQCRTWPFWPAHLHTLESWQRTQTFCPGTRQGPLVPIHEIEAQARRAAEALR